MPPIIHLVRHAEGLHNLGHAYWALIDPLLTENGRDQCLRLRREFPSHDNVELVVASPLSRAIFTAVEGFQPTFDRIPARQLVLLPDLQEISDFPCDVGTEVEELKARVRDLKVPIDWSFVHEGWTSKSGRYKPVTEIIEDRARDIRCWLSKRPEKEIAVVTHGAFLHFLTEDWEDSYTHEGTGWTNAEYRTFTTKPKESSGMDDASLIETVESRRRRGKTDPVPAAKEQAQLYVRALREWERQGYLLSAEDRYGVSSTNL
ncbi:phosphoglycerate mutase-like protein [Aspergillus steynii IBT 23096]|uniref:Phosphoglycerate mutase-like protein n=1 Tax=Aspergillus steynii IBT 23096 TaxID=1392250 RepID=A0A2I2G0A9_9EURO|nr:phosphoglycerate mutase-like protein [Aspergillus steynii IBT 23096]PLB46310.1 phosphoglycerate mutase-like protein [Aspergillus steynii IBT 23096]